jgi:putative ABC transport system permease protein
VNTYLRFPSPAAAKAFAARMPAFVVRHGTTDLGANADKTMQLTLLPLTDLHLTPAGREMASARQTILTLGIVGVLTLLIAIVNYVNLATARAGLRAREVAMRKVLGASRGMLVRQFAGEAILTTALAALVALALAELGLPLVNAAAGLALSIPYATVVPALLVLSVVVGIAAGLYPAVLLARFPAAAVLASARSPGGGRTGARLREMLVVFQFALATAFIAGTLVLVAQTRHLRQADLGFARDGLIVVKSLAGLSEGQQGAMRDAIADLPMIRSVGIADSAAGALATTTPTTSRYPGAPALVPRCARSWWGRGSSPPMAPA